MPIIKKCCWLCSLRIGSLIVAYLGIIYALVATLLVILYKKEFCDKVANIWLVSSAWNIVSGALLLVAVYRNNPNLLPLHLVTCLIGLILEMVSHMLIAASGVKDYELMAYVAFAIGFMTADTVIVLSYYQSER